MLVLWLISCVAFLLFFNVKYTLVLGIHRFELIGVMVHFVSFPVFMVII